MKRRTVAGALVCLVAVLSLATAQDKADLAAIYKIKDEGLNRSQVDLFDHNLIGEIPGTDKKGEIVMLGGHFDTWRSGTGATDNSAGCAVAMEAVRILQAAGLKPRRTVRIALWGGEESGLLGSRAYVNEHFAARPAAPAGDRQPVGGNRVQAPPGRGLHPNRHPGTITK